MAKVTVTRGYIGMAPKPVAWEALVRIFDAIWGPEKHSLPKYPQIIGAAHASWHDASGAEHEASSLDEVREAYESRETALISLHGYNETVHCYFRYCPARVEAAVEVQACDRESADRFIGAVRQEFPLVAKYVFVSYHTAELQLADYVKKVLEKRLPPGVSVFVAKRDISPGENPLKVMLEKHLLHAEALVALCSSRSKDSPWLWWESSAVWARGGLVVPLFIDLRPDECDGPITLVCQGRNFFETPEMNAALRALVARTCPGHVCEDLTPEEVAELSTLQSGHR